MGKHQRNSSHVFRDLNKKLGTSKATGATGTYFQKPPPQPAPPTAEEIQGIIEAHKKAKDNAPIIMSFAMRKLTEEEKQAEKDKVAKRSSMRWVFKSRSIHDSVQGMFDYFAGGRNHEWGRAGR